jgi:hypothetical protein
MEEIRNRARANLPTVLLTLLSIVQALALEFLWDFIRDTPDLLAFSWLNVLIWVQLAATLIGLVLIWIVYASHVMRLRWVPTTTDSVYPFAIGLLEFVMIELLGPATIGPWLICFATIFALMVWVSHRTMRRARLDGDNEAFFRSLSPAEFRDFIPGIAMIAAVAGAGVYLYLSNDTGILALLALLMTTGLAIHQFRVTASFWERSLSDDWPQRPNPSALKADDEEGLIQ